MFAKEHSKVCLELPETIQVTQNALPLQGLNYPPKSENSNIQMLKSYLTETSVIRRILLLPIRKIRKNVMLHFFFVHSLQNQIKVLPLQLI